MLPRINVNRPKVALKGLSSSRDPRHTPPASPQPLPEPIGRSACGSSPGITVTAPMPPPTDIPWNKTMSGGTPAASGTSWDTAPTFELPALPSLESAATVVAAPPPAEGAAAVVASEATSERANPPPSHVSEEEADSSAGINDGLAMAPPPPTERKHFETKLPTELVFTDLRELCIQFVDYDWTRRADRGSQADGYVYPCVIHVQMFPQCFNNNRTEVLQMLCSSAVVPHGVVAEVCGTFPIIQKSDGLESPFSFNAVVLTNDLPALQSAIHKRVLFDATGFWWANSRRGTQRLEEFCNRLRKQSTDVRHRLTHEMPCKALVFEQAVSPGVTRACLERAGLLMRESYPPPPAASNCGSFAFGVHPHFFCTPSTAWN